MDTRKKDVVCRHVNELQFFVKFTLVFLLYGVSVHIRSYPFISARMIWMDPPDELIHFLCVHSNKTLKINKKLQSNNSKVCGLYVLLFIKMKGRCWSWRRIMKLFKRSSQKNDSLLRKLFICK